jgi:hypothetical protein
MQSGDPFCGALNPSRNISVDWIAVHTDGPNRQLGISSCHRKRQGAVLTDLFKYRRTAQRYRARFETTQRAKLLRGLFTEFHTGGGTCRVVRFRRIPCDEPLAK